MTLYAQEVVQEEVIQVEAERIQDGLADTSEEIHLRGSAEGMAARNVSEIIEAQSSFKVNRYGAPGTYSTLSIRGSNADQVGIYINGLPLNDPNGGAVNLENLPLGAFDSIEVTKSFTPLYLPGSHIGGSVDLKLTKKNQTPQLMWSTGAHSLIGGHLGLGYRDQKQFHYVDGRGSLNRYQYLNNNGTLYLNTADDKLVTRHNEDNVQLGYTGFFHGNWGSNNVSFLLDTLVKRQGLAGVIANENEEVRFNENRLLSRFAIDSPLGNDIVVSSYTYLRLYHSDLKDPKQELSAGFSTQERLSGLFAVGFSPVWYANEHVTLRLISEGRFNKLLRDSSDLAKRAELDIGSSVEYLPFVWLGRIQGQAKANIVHDVPSRILNSTFVEDQTQPSALLRMGLFVNSILSGSRRKPNQNKMLELYASASYAERVPSISERYGDGGLLLASPNLRKEKSLTNSIGLQGTLPCGIFKCNVQAAYFLTAMTDLILLIANSQRTMIATNVGKAQLEGFELAMSFSYQFYIELDLRYTYLNAVDKGQLPFYRDRYLPYRPRHNFVATINVGPRDFKFFSGSTYQGANFRDRYNSYSNYLERRITVFTGVSYLFAENLNQSVTFTVKNLLDARQVDVIGYPVPGRSFEFKYEGRLDI